ncbi:MAG: ATP-binding protein [Nocardioidaceae bacterium]
MPAGTARTTTGITVSIARDPALVRTVRLVAAAVARRSSQDEEFVEEVRLAVGEACALLVGQEVSPGTTVGPVEVRMLVEDRLRVSVLAAGTIAAQDPPTSDIDGVEPWALLRGLIDDFEITQDAGTTVLSMSWPLT